MPRITIKRNLDHGDWMTLGPVAIVIVLWVIFKGLRYVP